MGRFSAFWEEVPVLRNGLCFSLILKINRQHNAGGLLCESHDVIGGAVKDSAQFFQGDQRDILILFQRVQRLVINAAFEKLILGHLLLLHRFP